MADDVSDRTERKIRIRQTIRVALFAVVALVLGAWAFSNTDDVDVDWLFDTTTVPLVVVIVASAALGFLLGLVAAARRRN